MRELFKKIINFEPAPRTLKWEFGYWDSTVERWYREGLPRMKGLSEKVPYGKSVVGPALPNMYYNSKLLFTEDYDISNFFNFDSGFKMFTFNYFFYPDFEEKIIFEDDTYIEKINNQGIRTREFKDSTSIPMWLEFPVKDRKDWEELKEERLNLNSINNRYMQNSNNYIKNAEQRNFIIGILGGTTGFFGCLRSLMGEEKLFMTYYDDPKLILDMVEHLCNLWLGIAEELTSKVDFDLAYFWEDMAGKKGSLISPSIFKEYMSPYYKKITGFLKTIGIDKFVVDTDGKVDELIPLFLESGVNMMYPFEQQAGNDLIEYRKKYPELVICGGFDKNALYKGKDAIDKELEKIKYLISRGGYIPYGDHFIPPNASWDNFKYYREKLNHIIDNTEIKGNKNATF